MKNLIVLADFPPVVGGTTIWYYRVCELLGREGYRIYALGGKGSPPRGVINLNQPPKKSLFARVFFLAYDGLTEALREVSVVMPLARRGLLKLSDAGYMVSFLLMIKRAMRVIPKEGGIVLASHANINSLFAYMLCKRHGKLKFVIREHGGGVLEFCASRPELVSFLLFQADYVNSVSKYIADECVSRGARADRVRVIFSARDIPEIKSPLKKENIVLFCGFLEPRKDPFTYIKAVKEFLARDGNAGKIRFVVIGRGALKARLQEFCRDNNLENSVQFTGELPIAQVWDWIKKSKVLVLPSIREPSGAVLTEAMAYKCYCVAANVGGIPELVTAERGSLFEPGDYKALAGLLHDFFDDEEKHGIKVSAAYEHVRSNYSFDKAAGQLAEIFEKLYST